MLQFIQTSGDSCANRYDGLLNPLLPLSIRSPPEVSSSYATASSSSDSTDTSTYSYTDDTTDSTLNRRGLRRLHDLYTGEHNPGADVLATTVGVAALYAAIPPTVRIMDEGYDPADEVRQGVHNCSGWGQFRRRQNRVPCCGKKLPRPLLAFSAASWSPF